MKNLIEIHLPQLTKKYEGKSENFVSKAILKEVGMIFADQLFQPKNYQDSKTALSYCFTGKNLPEKEVVINVLKREFPNRDIDAHIGMDRVYVLIARVDNKKLRFSL